MAQVVYKIRRTRALDEPAGGHGIELGGGSAASFVDIGIREDSYKVVLDKPMESPMLIQQWLDGFPSKVFMPRKAEATFSTNLRAAASRAGASVAIANVPDGKLWGVAMGGEFLGTGTTIQSTSTSTVLNVTSATGLREGGAIACATGVGGALECREIKTIASNVVTLKLAFSGVPANGSQVYAGATYYLDALDGSTVKSLQMLMEGQSAADRWMLKGGQVTSPPKLSLAPGSIPKVDWSWTFSEWLYADGTNVLGRTSLMNLASTAIADQSYSDAGINAVMDSELRITPIATSTLANTLVDAQQININPNFKYGPHRTPAGQNTIKQWVRLRPEGPACTGDFAVPYEDSTWRDRRDNETECAMFYQIGSSVTGGAVLISVPRICFDNFQIEEVDELNSQRIPFYAKTDTSTTGNATAIAKSVFRITVF